MIRKYGSGMSDRTQTTVNGGVGFTGLLTIVFIVLKLLGVISWSWLWVLSPIWIETIIVLIVLVVLIILYRRDTKWL
jgi:Flp pilus assembly protein TadB